MGDCIALFKGLITYIDTTSRGVVHCARVVVAPHIYYGYNRQVACDGTSCGAVLVPCVSVCYSVLLVGKVNEGAFAVCVEEL